MKKNVNRVVLVGTGFVGNTSFEDFSEMMVSMAKKASVPVASRNTSI